MSQTSKSKLRDPQNIIAVGVTIISLCALIVSVVQTQIMREEGELMREYSRKSVWPRLELTFVKGHNSDDGSINKFSLFLENNGIGPAIITDVKVSYKNRIANDWWDLFEIQEIPDSIETYIANESFNNRIIKIGENIEILNLSDNPSLAQVFFEKLEGLTIDIYYESVYKEKWRYDGENTIEIKNFEGLPLDEQFN